MATIHYLRDVDGGAVLGVVDADQGVQKRLPINDVLHQVYSVKLKTTGEPHLFALPVGLEVGEIMKRLRAIENAVIEGAQ